MQSRIVSSVLGSLVLAACASDGEPPDVGQTVYTPAVQTIRFEDHAGGFGTPPPPGPCVLGVATFTLTLATRHLEWSVCDLVEAPTLTTELRTGERDLAATELTMLEPKLAALVVVAPTSCGADKPLLGLFVTTDAGTIEYADSFYGCPEQDKPLIESAALDAVGNAFDALAH
jgi:hypothetical protein